MSLRGSSREISHAVSANTSMWRTNRALVEILAWVPEHEPLPTATPSWLSARATSSIPVSTRKFPTIRSRILLPSPWRPRPPNVLLVHPSIPANNLKELIAFLKDNNGKYSYAHSGIGTTSHLSGEMFRHSQDLDLVAVPFAGAAPAVQSTLAGHTPIAFTVLTPAVPQVREGKLRALAVTTPKRSPALPDVMTMAEAGLPGQESDTMSGVVVPAHTPPPIIELLHREIGKAMIEPEAAQKLTSLGFDTIDTTPEEFSSRIQTEIPKWAKVIQTAGIKAE